MRTKNEPVGERAGIVRRTRRLTVSPRAHLSRRPTARQRQLCAHGLLYVSRIDDAEGQHYVGAGLSIDRGGGGVENDPSHETDVDFHRNHERRGSSGVEARFGSDEAAGERTRRNSDRDTHVGIPARAGVEPARAWTQNDELSDGRDLDPYVGRAGERGGDGNRDNLVGSRRPRDRYRRKSDLDVAGQKGLRRARHRDRWRAGAGGRAGRRRLRAQRGNHARQRRCDERCSQSGVQHRQGTVCESVSR